MKLEETNHNPYEGGLTLIIAFFGPMLVLIFLFLIIYYIVTSIKEFFKKRHHEAKKIPINECVGLDLENIRSSSYSGELPGLIEDISILDTSSSVTHSSFRMLKNQRNNDLPSSDSQISPSIFDDICDTASEFDEQCDISDIDDKSVVETDTNRCPYPFKSQYNKKNN